MGTTTKGKKQRLRFRPWWTKPRKMEIHLAGESLILWWEPSTWYPFKTNKSHHPTGSDLWYPQTCYLLRWPLLSFSRAPMAVRRIRRIRHHLHPATLGLPWILPIPPAFSRYHVPCQIHHLDCRACLSPIRTGKQCPPLVLRPKWLISSKAELLLLRCNNNGTRVFTSMVASSGRSTWTTIPIQMEPLEIWTCNGDWFSERTTTKSLPVRSWPEEIVEIWRSQCTASSFTSSS